MNLKWKLARPLITIVSTLAFAGCSSIGTINGVSLDSSKQMGATNTSRETWCDQDDHHRWICILLAAGAVGGAIAVIASRDHKKPSPAPVEEEGGGEF